MSALVYIETEDAPVVPHGPELLKIIIDQAEIENPAITMVGDAPLIVLFDRVIAYIPQREFYVH